MPHFFTRQLLTWHAAHPRMLPWADGPRDPYHIWISEVIMQQTRLEQGAPYYHKFIKRFPTLVALASASLNEVLRSWEGLGYYSRARNLHAAARQIQDNYFGELPLTYDDLIQLPGVGGYTAAAIASFAFGLPYPVVDGNVKRLLSRFDGITDPINTPTAHEKIRSQAESYMRGADPADFNQAIMNFGALVCKPKPLCEICPLAAKCYAYQNGITDLLPVKAKKKANVIRHFHFIILHREKEVLLVKQTGKDIWQDMYVPPFIESHSSRSPSGSLMQNWIYENLRATSVTRMHSSGTIQQILSHQTIIGRFHHFEINASKKKPVHSKWLSVKTSSRVAKPRIIVQSLHDLFTH